MSIKKILLFVCVLALSSLVKADIEVAVTNEVPKV